MQLDRAEISGVARIVGSADLANKRSRPLNNAGTRPGFRANRPARNASPAISNRRTPNPRKFQILLLQFVRGLYKFSAAMSASVVSIQLYGTRKKQGPIFLKSPRVRNAHDAPRGLSYLISAFCPGPSAVVNLPLGFLWNDGTKEGGTTRWPGTKCLGTGTISGPVL